MCQTIGTSWFLFFHRIDDILLCLDDILLCIDDSLLCIACLMSARLESEFLQQKAKKKKKHKYSSSNRQRKEVSSVPLTHCWNGVLPDLRNKLVFMHVN